MHNRVMYAAGLGPGSRRGVAGRAALLLGAVVAAVASGGLGGCETAKSPIFEWAELRPSDEPTAGTDAHPQAGAGGVAGEVAMAGRSAPISAGAPAAIGLDPNAKFDWSATAPGGDACVGGRFTGPFSCSLLNSFLGIPSILEGTIDLTLVGPTERQTLDVSIGEMNVVSSNPGGWDVGLKGAVQCKTNAFLGQLIETTVTPQEVGPLIGAFWSVSTTTQVQGGLRGTLDPVSLGLSGEITVVMGTGMCSGRFQLRKQP